MTDLTPTQQAEEKPAPKLVSRCYICGRFTTHLKWICSDACQFDADEEHEAEDNYAY